MTEFEPERLEIMKLARQRIAALGLSGVLDVSCATGALYVYRKTGDVVPSHSEIANSFNVQITDSGMFRIFGSKEAIDEYRQRGRWSVWRMLEGGYGSAFNDYDDFGKAFNEVLERFALVT
jgi:hypothetical protein